MAKSRQEKWIMVRLRRATHRKLLDLERLWLEEYVKGRQTDMAPDERDGIGLDRIVSELLRRDEEHRKRGKRQAFVKGSKGSSVSETDVKPEAGQQKPASGKGIPLDDSCPHEGWKSGQ